MSCKATAHFAGTSQMHFVLSHDDVRRHQYLLEAAKRHRTIVCTPSIARNAEMQFTFGAFATDCKEKLMYELINARAVCAENDEWMYALQMPDESNGCDGTSAPPDPYTTLTTAAAKLLLIDAPPPQLGTPSSALPRRCNRDDICRLPGVSESAELLNASAAELLRSLPEGIQNRSTVSELMKRL